MKKVKETHGFKWFLGVLSENNANVNIVSTYIMRNFMATDFYYTENQIVKHRKFSNSFTSKEVLESIVSSTIILNKALKIPLAIGYLRTGSVTFTDASIKEYFLNPHHNFELIQKCDPPCKEKIETFYAMMVFKEYSYDLLLVKNSKKNNIVVKNKTWVQKVKDILQVVSKLLEKNTGKKVKKLKIQFFKNDFDEFWISYSYNCEFLHEFIILKQIQTFRDLKIKEELINNNYLLKIDTPEGSLEDSLKTSEKSLNFQQSPERIQNNPKKNQIFRVNEFANNDFFELLCRNRVKERKQNDLQLPSLMFYAEKDEIDAEKEKILRMMEVNPTIKFPKVDKAPRKSLWTKPLEARNFKMPRQSSPLISPQGITLQNSKTPSPPLSSDFKEFLLNPFERNAFIL